MGEGRTKLDDWYFDVTKYEFETAFWSCWILNFGLWKFELLSFSKFPILTFVLPSLLIISECLSNYSLHFSIVLFCISLSCSCFYLSEFLTPLFQADSTLTSEQLLVIIFSSIEIVHYIWCSYLPHLYTKTSTTTGMIPIPCIQTVNLI